MELLGRCLVAGSATGELLYTETGLSFWGGVDPLSGEIVDRHHDLCGQTINGKILAMPCGKGSCTGSMLMLELLLNECAPAALIFEQLDQIITLGVLVAKSLFEKSIPVVLLQPLEFEKLRARKYAAVGGGVVRVGDAPLTLPAASPLLESTHEIQLSSYDKSLLAGGKGRAAQVAMELLLEFATLQGARQLIDITQSHIDACVYTGPASLRFAETILAIGAKFVVPTTLNAISIDKRRWKEIGMDEIESAHAGALANAYLAMGAMPSFTCAPYALETAPKVGENTGWGESNAVIFANSVLGARTQKYPDFIDVCMALTGRAPLAGCHLPEGRAPSLIVHVNDLGSVSDATYPLLGYMVGKLARHRIALVTGLEHLEPTTADLKAFSAAVGTTSSAPMFHIRDVTPEAGQFSALAKTLPNFDIAYTHLLECSRALNTAQTPSVELVSLGNPHFLFEEFAYLAQLCQNRTIHPKVSVMVTTNREVYGKAYNAGFIDTVEKFGVLIITDTCWCMLGEPVIGKNVVNIMTNSAKYAHYAPGMVKRGIHFGSLKECIDAACAGEFYFDEKDMPSE